MVYANGVNLFTLTPHGLMAGSAKSLLRLPECVEVDAVLIALDVGFVSFRVPTLPLSLCLNILFRMGIPPSF
jgi:hypothetical protein